MSIPTERLRALRHDAVDCDCYHTLAEFIELCDAELARREARPTDARIAVTEEMVTRGMNQRYGVGDSAPPTDHPLYRESMRALLEYALGKGNG